MNEMNRIEEQRPDVILSVLKLARALRRRPPHPQGGFPPAVERFLQVLFENDHLSSRELCEVMDVRPSTMSEMIGRMEEQGMIERENDPSDRRVSRVTMTEKGRGAAEQICNSKRAESDRMSACFTDEEAKTFCTLCDRLSVHLESLPGEEFPPEHPGDHCPPPPPFGAPGDFPPPPPPFGGPHHGRGPGGSHGFGRGEGPFKA